MNAFLNLLVVVACLALSGLFACIAVMVWEPGKRQGLWVRVEFTCAVILGTMFAVASLLFPWLEI